MKEFDLYEPMCKWLENYIKGKYKGYKIIVKDTHSITLDKALKEIGIINDLATGIDIEIDVLGVAIKGDKYKLLFIEAKATKLTLRDLGQLWSYCKLIDPEEAFLFSPKGLGSLNKILVACSREDMLDFGDGKKIKKMRVASWDISTGSPDILRMIPKF